jgi:hypothetical protein
MKILDFLIKQLSDQLIYSSLTNFVNMNFGFEIRQKIKENCFSLIDDSLINRDLEYVKNALNYLFDNFAEIYPELNEMEFKISSDFGLIERIFSQFNNRDLGYHFLACLSLEAQSFTLSNYYISEEDIFLSKLALIKKLQPELASYARDKFFHLRITNPILKKLLIRPIYIESREAQKLNLVKNVIYRFTSFDSNTYKSAVNKTLEQIHSLKEMMTTLEIEFVKHYDIRLINLLRERIFRVLQDSELNLLLGQAREFIIATVIDTILNELEKLPYWQYLPMDINRIILNSNELSYLHSTIFNPQFRIVVRDSTSNLELDVETLAGISKAFEEKNIGEIYLQNIPLPSYSQLFRGRNFNLEDERFQRGYTGALQWLA